MEYKISYATYTGVQHYSDNRPCQDRINIRWSDETAFCVALADGAGSRLYSEVGAECVSSFVAEYISANFELLWESDSKLLSQTIISLALEELEQQEHSAYDMACTLLFFAAHRDGRYIMGHLGDGVQIGYREGVLYLASEAENGEEANQTYFVTTEDADEHLRICRGVNDTSGGIMLMSDGTAECLFNYQTEVPAPACRTIFEWLNQEDEIVVNDIIAENMDSVFSKHTSDDMSLAVVIWR